MTKKQQLLAIELMDSPDIRIVDGIVCMEPEEPILVIPPPSPLLAEIKEKKSPEATKYVLSKKRA